MTINEKLLLMKQMEEANILSIERYLARGEKESIQAMVRRNAKENKLMRDIVKDILKDDKNGL